MWLARLLYFSSRLDIDRGALDGIMDVSRFNNLQDDITGALISSNRYFVQLLEGDRMAINRRLTRIMRDPRHHDLQIVSAGTADRRLFRDWSMQRIDTSRIRTEVLAPYLISRGFRPPRLSQFALEHLCQTLSTNEWQASVA